MSTSGNPATYGCGKPNRQHTFDHTGCVISDFVISQGAQANGALEFACASIGVINRSDLIVDSYVHKASVYPHDFLCSYVSIASAR